ncbi:IclR family transcriptional regulator [Bradyrhizobium sp. LHD-71]|uniref:IclR family transcriptional regulator n=1 Tax=Bradyrhizobium sp. LHD-71 TaxID=3072141 RepID=UPI00280E9C10|nr:IclR family transcriptional regulator [Bradyrhizobium sp. LHD-71]MDQ8729946.1 IclR family transcriptional regulator [Bradyrhizobium sp. LHD-71]
MVGRPRQQKPSSTLSRRQGLDAKRQEVHQQSALGRGLLILRAFEIGDPPLGNATLAERTGLAKATVSRLTQTLLELGYLQYRGEIGKYELAPSVLGLCHSYLGNMPVPAVARPAMLELAREGQVNVGLAIQDGLSMVYVESALGEPMSGRQRVGLSVPIHVSAIGLACIGGMTAEQREALSRQLFQASTPEEWRMISARIDEATAQVHTRGFYLGLGTLSPNTNMLGVPFFYEPSGVMMAFNCGGSSPVQTAEKLSGLGPKLIDLVVRVRGELGTMSAPYTVRR